MVKLFANDTYREVWAVRYGPGHRMNGLKRVEPTIAAAELDSLDYQTEPWRIKWFQRNLMHFRTVEPAR